MVKMKSLDYTYCSKQDSCEVTNCPVKLTPEQKDYMRDHPQIPVSFADFEDDEICLKEKRIKGTLHLWSK